MDTKTTAQNPNLPLGVFASREHIFLFYLHHQGETDTFQIDSSTDGINFNHHYRGAQIRNLQKRKVKLKYCRDLRITQLEQQYFLTHKYSLRNKTALYGALSQDLIRWKHLEKISSVTETGILVANYLYHNSFVMYFGESALKLALSPDLKNWQIGKTVLESQTNFYGQVTVKVGAARLTEAGILLLYFTQQAGTNFKKFSLNSALFDKNDPAKLLRIDDKPIWESDEAWVNKDVSPLGVVDFHGQLISYWRSGETEISAVFHPLLKKWLPQHKHFASFLLQKVQHNPIIKPIVEHYWESRATFNPAAVYEDGQVHIVYRAVGDQDVSVLGYATSSDGLHIDYRHQKPIYVPREHFEVSQTNREVAPYSKFASGGGIYGGCEDPRITKIADRFYMTYVAYNGYHHPRVALTSIAVNDFLNHRWQWSKPVLISPPGAVDKNACVLPEKIKGKYVIFHRIFPNILIDFVDSLEFDGETYLQGEYQIRPRADSWDSRKIGVGAPPIKTDLGWLLIYQAVGDADPSRYKMGAMLLDLNDPTKVLHRTQKPILEPHEWYENEGHKAGVAYPCGAVNLNNQLLVYYGGADTVVCAAKTPLPDFLGHLTASESATLTPVTSSINIIN